MTAKKISVFKLFYCYAHEDSDMRERLDAHLAPLKHQKLIEAWYDRKISPGTEWEREIESHLNTAHIILLLISPCFMASEYCYGREMKVALERHEKGEARVIPILIHPVYWENAPFSKLQMLPSGAIPASLWTNCDAALAEVVVGIQRAIKDIIAKLEVSEQQAYINLDLEAKLDEKKPVTREVMLQACDQAIQFDPNNARLHYNRGEVLLTFKRYEEAVQAYDQAIHLEPNNIEMYQAKGGLLQNLKRYEEALQAYDQIIHLELSNTKAYWTKGSLLQNLKRYEEALQVYDQIIHLEPNNTKAYQAKGGLLQIFKRYEEALWAYDQAIQHDPGNTKAYQAKGGLLQNLKRYEEALQTYDQAIQYDHSNGQLYYNKGEIFRILKQYKEALNAYDLAIQFNPQKISAHYFRGFVLEKLNYRKEALKEYFKAASLKRKS
jgi:tetratricopeptide (TPR) repeat protein